MAEECKQCTFMPYIMAPTDGGTVDNGVKLCNEVACSAGEQCCDKIDYDLRGIWQTLETIADRIIIAADKKCKDAEKTVETFVSTLAIYIAKITNIVTEIATRVDQKSVVINFNQSCPELPKGGDKPKIDEGFKEDDETFVSTPTPPAEPKACKIEIVNWEAAFDSLKTHSNASYNLGEVVAFMDIERKTIWVGKRDGVKQMYSGDLPFAIYTSWAMARSKLLEDIHTEEDNPELESLNGKCNFLLFVVNFEEDTKQPIDEEAEAEKRKRELLQLVATVPHWNNPAICNALELLFAGGSQGKTQTLSQMLGLRDKDGNPDIPKPIIEFVKSSDWIPDSWASTIADVFGFFTDTIDTTVASYGAMTGCDFKPILGIIGTRLVLDIVSRFTGVELSKAKEGIDKAIDYACPMRLPSTAEATAAWLSDSIDMEQWQCWVKADNSVVYAAHQIAVSQRTKPGTHELIQAWLRGMITDDELWHGVRKLGWLDGAEFNLVRDLAFVTPTPSDLIPMMVRDVFDETVIEEFKLDAEFEAKFGGDAEKLFRSAGLTKDIAKLHWLFHWKNPSNTQLFEMYHRNRGGNEPTEHFEYFDHEGKPLPAPKQLSKDDIKVSEKDIARALGVNDVAPFWRNRLLAISRPPLTRVDTRRAYDIDAITKEQVYESYRDLGYSHENATTLTNFADTLKKKGDIKRKGYLQPTKIVSLYKTQSLTREEARESLIAAMLKPEDADKALQQAEIEVKAKVKSKCLAAVRKRYMIGDIDDAKLVAMLQDIGLDQNQSIAVREELRCALQLKTKEVTAIMLCQWYADGLVTKTHHIVRLQRIGYSREDALRIADSCEIRANEAAEKSKGARGKPKKEREKREDEVKRGKLPEGEIPEPPKPEVKNGEKAGN